MKTIQLLLGILCFFFASNVIVAREANYVQGDILVQISENAQIATIVNDIQSLNGKATNLILKKCVAQPFRIYLLQFNPINIRQSDMLQAIRRHPAVIVAQNNHLIQLRETTPNDLQFNQQWQYINLGGDNAVANADLDADLAWDISTGGTTPLGDTIVVAVLDEGCKSNHPDWGNNLWKNYAEIPNNNIDDDGNGYIDDYKGWNIYDNNDNIDGDNFSGSHGTCVAGIIGAKGNNNTGVTGVNWNVKIMFILASGNESDAIGGYTYAYTMRQRYNNSNGQEGAFVVSTNASWGINQGQPADAPLWCALYDQMGNVGILSAGATANANFDIDIVGDLPTACPSDYLISVTNMGKNDLKIGGAGYGLNTIDLGAYGENIYTLAGNLGYDGFGGTSGATPHVTGTIALLYSVQCPAFTLFAKADPAAAALLVKQMIMNGTTPNASLSGKCVTGGRLNMFNSLLLMQDYNCSTDGCTIPYNINANNITTNSALINWSEINIPASYNVYYRIAGNSNWTVNNSTASPHSLTALQPCTTYQIALQALCDTTNSDTTNIITFTTDGCCVPPTDISITPNTTNTNLTWNTITAALTYTIVLTDSNGTSSTHTATGNNYNLSNLTPCSNYTLQIASNCGGGLSNYTPTQSFTTLGCGTCIDANYCAIVSEANNYEWIDNFQLGTIENNSGAADNGYGNHTNLSSDLSIGANYNAQITVGYAIGTYLEFARIWIDYNQNGIFDDAEIAYQTANTDGESSPINANISIPATAQLGATRMRVMLKYTGDATDNAPPTACTNPKYGEIEDYCVNIVATPECVAIPLGLQLVSVSQNSAQITWTNNALCTSYTVRYRRVGTANWTTINASTANATINDLTPNTNYEVAIACNCNTSTSSFSEILPFTTQISGINLVQPYIVFDIIPNPFQETISINIANINNHNDDELYLYDISGKKVFQQKHPNNNTTWLLDLSHLKSGLYIAEYKHKEQIIGRTKLVKQ